MCVGVQGGRASDKGRASHNPPPAAPGQPSCTRTAQLQSKPPLGHHIRAELQGDHASPLHNPTSAAQEKSSRAPAQPNPSFTRIKQPSGSLGHHIGAVLEEGDAAEALRLALRVEHWGWQAKSGLELSFQRTVMLRKPGVEHRQSNKQLIGTMNASQLSQSPNQSKGEPTTWYRTWVQKLPPDLYSPSRLVFCSGCVSLAISRSNSPAGQLHWKQAVSGLRSVKAECSAAPGAYRWLSTSKLDAGREQASTQLWQD